MSTARKPWTSLVDGRGPDHFMELVFDRDVRGFVRSLDTTGFVRIELADTTMCSAFRGGVECAGHDLYVDDAHADQLRANLDGTGATNVWHYQIMTVGAGRVWFEHGYGATDDRTLAAEMRLVEAVTRDEVGLIGWSIEFGGQGYEHGIVRSGSSAEDLAAALAPPTDSTSNS